MRVLELGAGTLTMAQALVAMGAASVVCVDKERLARSRSKRISVVEAYHDDYFATADRRRAEVVFVSWPRNVVDAGLLCLAEEATKVVYLGKNTDGVACGFPLFWTRMLRRSLLAYVARKENTLIVYGAPLGMARSPRGEEFAAAHEEEGPFSYEEVEGLADSRVP